MKSNLAKNELPIGVFDSGMGGLTVLRALKNVLPKESFIYLGDTARLPYGTKGPDTIIRYAVQMAKLLVERNIKLMVVACNTATTAALPYLQEWLPDLPIIGVVEPGALVLAKATQNNHVAVLATEATVKSGVYEQMIYKINPNINVNSYSCGLFVALAEEGCIDNDISLATAKQYLTPIMNQKSIPDTILLGCTHFPVLTKSIKTVVNNDVKILDSATATAEAVVNALQKANLENNSDAKQIIQFMVTDLPERFARVGQIFYGDVINSEIIELIF